MTTPKKISLEELKSSMQVFLDFPEVEDALNSTIEEQIKSLLLTRHCGNKSSQDIINDYLGENLEELEMRIRAIVGLSFGSLERVKRIYEAMYPGYKWSKNIIKRDPVVRARISHFLANQYDKEIFIPGFIRDSFNLPSNWLDLLQSSDYLRIIVRNTLKSKYAVSMGQALENQIIKIVKDLGFSYQKGPVSIVDHKEVDVAIPNTTNPQVLIMSSYQLTTSSAQSSKSNEQKQMWDDVRRYNERKEQLRSEEEVIFINVIDGGGWLSRQNELEWMYRNCDYCFSRADLDALREVLDYHLEPVEPV